MEGGPEEGPRLTGGRGGAGSGAAPGRQAARGEAVCSPGSSRSGRCCTASFGPAGVSDLWD